MMLPVGTILRERYRIDKYLASGGFGNTYKVHDAHLNEDFVIKEFFCRTINSREADSHTVTVSNPSNTADFEGLIGKFRKEALRIRALKGEHIVHVHDLFDENGTAYYVMDFIDGESLSAVVKRGGPIPETEVLGYLGQMLDGLDEMHSRNIWHLDLKPGNMMIDGEGTLKLIDFGASKLIDTNSVTMSTSLAMAYTPGYAPIEQTEQRIGAIGAHTDLYAIGATLYSLLTAERPPSFTEINESGDEAFHYPSTVSKDMRMFVSWLMQPLRVNRPQNVAEIRQWLTLNDKTTMLPVVATKPQNAPVVSIAETSSKASKKKWLWPLVAVAICLIGAGCYYGYKAFKKSQIDYTTYNLELVAAAEDGDADAQAALGDCYQYGNGVTIDLKKAFEWYQKAAEQNHPIGLYGLGACYYEGNGFERDTTKGLEYLNQAGRILVKMEDSRNPEIINRIGISYLFGFGVEKNEAKGVSLLRNAVEYGDARTQYILGYCYDEGIGVAKDEEEAVKLYRKAAEQGLAGAQNNLGVCYENGEGIAKDTEEAVKWYRKAAEQGLALAQSYLGNCYLDGVGVAEDAEEAVKWYRIAAEQRDSWAQFNLGWCYENGIGVAKDAEEAVKWYRKAAEQGDAMAQSNLGYCYENGIGVAKDAKEAVKWYRKAAEQGNAKAQNNLGVCYETGEGVAKDKAEAIKWYQKSARQGDKTAQQNLRILGKSW